MGDRRWLLLILLLTALVQLPALRSGYVYDDRRAILANPDLRSLSGLPQVITTNYWGRGQNIGLYRPLTQLTYLLEGVTTRFAAPVSHAVNLLLHLVVVALMFLLLRGLGLGVAVAATSALLFGIHPALLDASVWISGRCDVLATACVLMGLLVTLRLAREEEPPALGQRGMLALGALFLLGLMSKEMAAGLLLLVPLLAPRHRLRLLVPPALALLVYLVLRAVAVDGFLPSGTEGGVVLRDRLWNDRLAVAALALVRLLALLPLPLGLAADHRADPLAAPDASTGPPAALAVGLLIAMFVLGRRLARRAPGPGFLLSAVPITLLPVLQIVPIGAVMAERFLYLPAVFLLGFLTWLLAGWFRAPAARRALALAACVFLAVITWMRIPVYADEGAFFSDVVRAYPGDHQAWNNLGVFLWQADPPRYRAAEEAFRKAIEARRASSSLRYTKATLNLARLLLDRQRETGGAQLLDVAVAVLDVFKEKRPEERYLRGKLAARRARLVGADRQALLEQAFELHGSAARGFASRGAAPRRVAAAWKEAGLAARALGDRVRAHAAFEKARSADPTIRVPGPDRGSGKDG